VRRINQRLVIPDARRAGAMRRIVKKVPCFFLSRKKTPPFRGKEESSFLKERSKELSMLATGKSLDAHQ
jgi:hypothetical protein